MLYAVGLRLNDRSGHVVVDADDALAAALKVKHDQPTARINYVRRQNRRGDTRHPAGVVLNGSEADCRLGLGRESSASNKF